MNAQLPSDAACWPTPERELLLGAGLWERERALAAWTSWRRSTPLDDLEGHTSQLLPLVYRNLAEAAGDDPEWSRVRGIYRRYWSNNQLLLHDALGVLGRLQGAGVPTLVLKGVALSRIYYPDAGCRPMVDVDLLVPPDRPLEAIALLEGSGWESAIDGIADGLETRHSASFHGSRDGSDLDLHWNVFWQPTDETDFWERAVPLELSDEVSTLALSPTDQLLHVLAHGTYWSTVTFRWVADAIMLTRRAEVDWALFAATARRHEVSWGLADMLAYLRERFGLRVEDGTLAELRAIPVSRSAARGHVALASPTSITRELRANWDRYARVARANGRHATPWGFAAHLRLVWNDPSYLRLAGRGVRRLFRGPPSWARTT